MGRYKMIIITDNKTFLLNFIGPFILLFDGNLLTEVTFATSRSMFSRTSDSVL